MFIELFLINSLAWSVVGRLNILLIVVDDLRPSLGCYGDTKAFTPNMDRLAKESVIFTQAYAQQSLCAPSRNSFLTGRRPDTLQLYDFYSYWRDTAGNFTTLPEHLRSNGYTTMSVGKVFHPGISSNGSDDCPYSWSEKPFHPYTDRYKEAPVCRNTKTSIPARNLVCPVSVSCMPNGTLPDIETLNAARSFIHEHRKDNQPFFLAVGFQKPHIPLKYPQQYLKLHPLSKFELPESYRWPNNVSHVAYNPWTDLRKRDDVEELLLKFPYEKIPQNFAKSIIQSYYAAVTYVDDLIGMLMDQLTISQIRDNTSVILISDHGWSLGEHAEWAKYSNFDVALRVPVMVSIPGVTFTSATNKEKCKSTTEDVANAPVEQTTQGPCGVGGEYENVETLLQKFEKMKKSIDSEGKKQFSGSIDEKENRTCGGTNGNKMQNDEDEIEMELSSVDGKDVAKEAIKEIEKSNGTKTVEQLDSPHSYNCTENNTLLNENLIDVQNAKEGTMKRIETYNEDGNRESNYEVIPNRNDDEPVLLGSWNNTNQNCTNKSPPDKQVVGEENMMNGSDSNEETNAESQNEVNTEGNQDNRKFSEYNNAGNILKNQSTMGIKIEGIDEANETESLETLLKQIEAMMKKGNENSNEESKSKSIAVGSGNSSKTDTISSGDKTQHGPIDGSPSGTENEAQKSEKWSEKIETLIKKFENMLRGIETSAGGALVSESADKNAVKGNSGKLESSSTVRSQLDQKSDENIKKETENPKDDRVLGTVEKYKMEENSDGQELNGGRGKHCENLIKKFNVMRGNVENKKSDEFIEYLNRNNFKGNLDKQRLTTSDGITSSTEKVIKENKNVSVKTVSTTSDESTNDRSSNKHESDSSDDTNIDRLQTENPITQNAGNDGEKKFGNVESLLKNFEYVKKLIDNPNNKPLLRYIDDINAKSNSNRHSFPGNRNDIQNGGTIGNSLRTTTGVNEGGNGFVEIKKLIKRFENMVKSAIIKYNGESPLASTNEHAVIANPVELGRLYSRDPEKSLQSKSPLDSHDIHKTWGKGNEKIGIPEQVVKNIEKDIGGSRSRGSSSEDQKEKFMKTNSNDKSAWKVIGKGMKGRTNEEQKFPGIYNKKNFPNENAWYTHGIANTRTIVPQKFKTPQKNSNWETSLDWEADDRKTKESSDKKGLPGVNENNIHNSPSTESVCDQNIGNARDKWNKRIIALQKNIEMMNKAHHISNDEPVLSNGNSDKQEPHDESPTKGELNKQEPPDKTVPILDIDKQKSPGEQKTNNITPTSGSCLNTKNTCEKWKDKMKSLLKKIESINDGFQNSTSKMPFESSNVTNMNGSAGEPSSTSGPSDESTMKGNSDSKELPGASVQKVDFEKQNPPSGYKNKQISLPIKSSLDTHDAENSKEKCGKALRKKVENINKAFKNSSNGIPFASLNVTHANESADKPLSTSGTLKQNTTEENTGNYKRPLKTDVEQQEPPNGDMIIHVALPIKTSLDANDTENSREKWIKALRKKVENLNKGFKNSNSEIPFESSGISNTKGKAEKPLSTSGSPNENTMKENIKELFPKTGFEKQQPSSGDKIIRIILPTKSSLDTHDTGNVTENLINALRKKVENTNKGFKNSSTVIPFEASDASHLEVNADKPVSPTEENTMEKNTGNEKFPEEGSPKTKYEKQEPLRREKIVSVVLPTKSSSMYDTEDAKEKWIKSLRKKIERMKGEIHSESPDVNDTRGNADTPLWTLDEMTTMENTDNEEFPDEGPPKTKFEEPEPLNDTHIVLSTENSLGTHDIGNMKENWKSSREKLIKALHKKVENMNKGFDTSSNEITFESPDKSSMKGNTNNKELPNESPLPSESPEESSKDGNAYSEEIPNESPSKVDSGKQESPNDRIIDTTFSIQKSLDTHNIEDSREKWIKALQNKFESLNRGIKTSNNVITFELPNESTTKGDFGDEELPNENLPAGNVNKQEEPSEGKIINNIHPIKNSVDMHHTEDSREKWIKTLQTKMDNMNKIFKTSNNIITFALPEKNTTHVNSKDQDSSSLNKTVQNSIPVVNSLNTLSEADAKEQWYERIKTLQKKIENINKALTNSNSEITMEPPSRNSIESNSIKQGSSSESTDENAGRIDFDTQDATGRGHEDMTSTGSGEEILWADRIKSQKKAMNEMEISNGKKTFQSPSKSSMEGNSDKEEPSVGDENLPKIPPSKSILGTKNIGNAREKWIERIKSLQKSVVNRHKELKKPVNEITSGPPNQETTQGNTNKEKSSIDLSGKVSPVISTNMKNTVPKKITLNGQHIESTQKWAGRIKAMQQSVKGIGRSKNYTGDHSSKLPDESSTESDSDRQEPTGSDEIIENNPPIESSYGAQNNETGKFKTLLRKFENMFKRIVNSNSETSSMSLITTTEKAHSANEESTNNNKHAKGRNDSNDIVMVKTKENTNKTESGNVGTVAKQNQNVKQCTESTNKPIIDKVLKKTDENNEDEGTDETVIERDKNNARLKQVKKEFENSTETRDNSDTEYSNETLHKISSDKGNERNAINSSLLHKDKNNDRFEKVPKDFRNVTNKLKTPIKEQSFDKSDKPLSGNDGRQNATNSTFHDPDRLSNKCGTPSEPSKNQNRDGQPLEQMQLFQIVKTSQKIKNNVHSDLKKFGLDVDQGGRSAKKIDLVEIEMPKKKLQSDCGDKGNCRDGRKSEAENGKISILSISMGSAKDNTEKSPVPSCPSNELSKHSQDTFAGSRDKFESSLRQNHELKLEFKGDNSENGVDDVRGNRKAKIHERSERIKYNRRGNEMKHDVVDKIKSVRNKLFTSANSKRHLAQITKRRADEDTHWARRRKKHRRKHRHRKEHEEGTDLKMEKIYREREGNLHKIYESLQKDHEELKKNHEMLIKDHDRLDELLMKLDKGYDNEKFGKGSRLGKYSNSEYNELWKDNDQQIFDSKKDNINIHDQKINDSSDEPDSQNAKIGFELNYIRQVTNRKHTHVPKRNKNNSKDLTSVDQGSKERKRKDLNFTVQRLTLEPENTATVLPQKERSPGVKYVGEETTLVDSLNDLPLYDGMPERTEQQEPSRQNYIMMDSLIELVDIFPTIADIAEYPIPLCPDIEDHYADCEKPVLPNPCSEGISLLPVIEAAMSHKIIAWKKAAFSQYPRPGVTPTLKPNSDKPRLKDIAIMGYTIRTRKYRYTAWVPFAHISKKPDWRTIIAEELYDHSLEAGENLNVAYGESFQKLREELKAQLRRGWRMALPEQCKSEDQKMEELFKSCGKG